MRILATFHVFGMLNGLADTPATKTLMNYQKHDSERLPRFKPDAYVVANGKVQGWKF